MRKEINMRQNKEVKVGKKEETESQGEGQDGRNGSEKKLYVGSCRTKEEGNRPCWLDTQRHRRPSGELSRKYEARRFGQFFALLLSCHKLVLKVKCRKTIHTTYLLLFHLRVNIDIITILWRVVGEVVSSSHQ